MPLSQLIRNAHLLIETINFLFALLWKLRSKIEMDHLRISVQFVVFLDFFQAGNTPNLIFLLMCFSRYFLHSAIKSWADVVK